MPERLECEVLQKARYINTRTFTFTITSMVDSTKVICPLFDDTDILIPSDNLSILPSLDKIENVKC